MIKNTKKKGFTLVELLVVLTIMGIIIAIAVPSFINYWKRAEFRKNESNAKTIYLAAESKLTYYRSSGQWEKFKKQVKKQGEVANFFKDDTSTTYNEAELNGRIYAITLDANEEANKKTNAVLQLIDDYIQDKDMMKGSIGIEIDIETGEVYSAFYGTKCKGLTYDANDADGYLTMQKRDYDSRRERLLGYYSTEDTTNVVKLKPTRLRITTISLQNSEKLSLNWSSNVGQAQDVSYEIKFYNKGDKDKKNVLFSMVVSPYELRKNGWSSTSEGTENLASIKLKDKDGNDKGNWTFPLTYSDNKYSLVLDAMMSAKVQDAINKVIADEKKELEQTSSTSICRLAEVNESLKNEQDIYATVKATAYKTTDKNQTIQSSKEYRDSEETASNSANTMYADNTSGNDVKIATFRHLSNIRYYNKEETDTTTTTFTLTNKNMEWTAVGTGVYDFVTDAKSNTSIQLLKWTESSKSKPVDFPTIAELKKYYELDGNGTQTLISNLKLGQNSIVAGAKNLGLFGEVKGTINKVALKNATLKFEVGTDNTSYNSVQTAGILAGRSEGTLSNITIQSTNAKNDTSKTKVDVILTNTDCAAVGGIVGMLSGMVTGTDNGQLTRGTISNATMEGVIDVTLPTIADVNTDTQNSAFGIGGVVGYVNVENNENTGIKNCINHADVSGNYFTGGIAGKVNGSFVESKSSADLKTIANISDSSNDGMILCTTATDTNSIVGRYFGGILGYGNQTLIYNSSSASGRASGFTFDASKKEELLKGTYVGGIIGFGQSSLVNSCSTQKNGYILGSDDVGGIAGGFSGGVSEAIRADGNVSVTTNASYVIGNSYIGGIIGRNSQGVTLSNCINNGVAAGYKDYVGGIVGYNDSGATIKNCASYLSDYDNSIFNMITQEWEATADYAGGIAGYNNGAIQFDANSQAITVKSVSSIVVGEDYVGGVAGFNDIQGTLDVHYTLIGGRIYGYGDCVGGGFGFNASENLLTQTLTIKPRSVQGRYYVGGCIGANVVNLKQDVIMNQFRADNVLGTITGDAFCGGIVGYQRTYTTGTSGQLTEENGSIRASVAANKTNLLPQLNENNNVPTSVSPSNNPYKLMIATQENNGLAVATNNIPIQANIYVGGIVGYCEKNSNLVIKNCKNVGNISNVAGNNKSVSLQAYTAAEVGGAQGEDIELHIVGGIISANLENQVIDNCTNSGSLSGYSGTGGIVGLNTGLVINCILSEHFGNATLSYLGGIAGINACDQTAQTKNYVSGTQTISYNSGLIQNCSTASGKTISGKNNIGGITGWNLQNAQLKEDTSYANITASGNNVGGVTGRNSGTIYAAAYNGTSNQRITSGGNVVGGLIGVNESTGKLEVETSGTKNEVVVVGNSVTVNGYEQIGGIVGVNHGKLESEDEDPKAYIVCQARQVRASHGTVGGIVGITDGNIARAINRSDSVTADAGLAGGITASNERETISDCENDGNVSSSNGYAGGIVATNAGTIQNCKVGSIGTNTTVIYSLGTDELGVISAVNTGTIINSRLTDSSDVKLQGDATKFGGITGRNEGTVTGTTTATGIMETEITKMPTIESTKTNLTVGGAVGENLGKVSYVKANGLNFENFSGYQYLGGIVGTNGNASHKDATVTNSSYSGTMTEQISAAGNCYGGIAGINYATLEDDSVKEIHLSVQGIYTATSTSTEEQKEASASHAGGITGKNEISGVIQACTLEDNSKSSLSVKYGMLGGIAGFNKGTINLSGSNSTSDIFAEVDLNNVQIDDLDSKAQTKIVTDNNPVNCSGKSQISDMKYYTSNKGVSSGRLGILVEYNGNLGGITAFNGTTGKLTGCVSGNWLLVNKSEAVGVGTGGVIGMNESEKELNGLINGAFVGRQLSGGKSNRFAGGIIGNQNNSSSTAWSITNCINYGTVYCYNTHYSGGIMGQWTGSGGTIQNCRNYGDLQTTYGEGWVGASGGIVAQLYHAYEENEYNIIGCANFGNIYTKNGASIADDSSGANDSAGILGNVTTYRVNSVSEGQKFTIQILDCVNGAGVGIYSKSMASGIVGFFSTDFSDVSSWADWQKSSAIEKSTQNIELRIERCQNYAEILQGTQFCAGIFGDRYGWTGCQNTTVTDCYSLNREGRYYNKNNYPIYSYKNGKGKAEYMKAENRTNNYFAQGNDKWDGWKLDKIKLDYQNTEINYNKSEISVKNELSENGFSDQYAQYEYLLTDETNNLFFIATIYPGNTVNSRYATITNTGYIVPKDNTSQPDGKVLFYLDKSYNEDGGYYKVWDKMMAKGSNFYQLAREGYRNIEGIDSNNTILKPASASATIKDGKINIEITPQNLPNSLKNEKCNPFLYNIKVSDGANEKVYKLYTETGSFDIPENLSGNLKVSVQSVSMFEDVQPSEWEIATVKQTEKVLPAPDVRVELVRTGSVSSSNDDQRVKNYAYQFKLNNASVYDEYPGWQVKVNIQGSGTITLDEQHESRTMAVTAGTYQMTAQATAKDYESSATKSLPVYLPQYRPSITLKTWTPQATPKVDISGDDLENLSVNIELDGSRTGIIENPPIYRAELVGTWNGESDVVFAQTDMLTVSNGKATASFTNLPDYISKVEDLKVRIWYAQSGLGPVYAYYDVDKKADANVKILESVKDDKETWKYQFSTSLESFSNYFDNYKYLSNKILTWLPAPSIKQVSGPLGPTVDTNGNLKYTFSWDSKLAATEETHYKVSLVGIDANNREITIDTSSAYTDNTQRKLTIDGSDWNYKEVRLKVTRIGDAEKKQIGLSSTETFEVKQRLEQPGQPSVENIDENELKYRISWSPISSEEGCAGYQAYIQTYDDKGALETAKEIGSLVKTSDKTDGSYTMTVNLEEYAGKRVVIYLVAKASENANYLDSADGVTYELQIPNRLPAPNVSWSVNWNYDKTKPTEAEDFNNGGLKVSLLTKDAASIPPGGSAYLLKAYVYNSEAEARQSTIGNTAGSIAEYPGGDVPIQMDVTDSQHYYHELENFSIKYAGKWIVFYARISSGGGNVSSHWARSEEVYQLPYVKLAEPAITSDVVESKLPVTVTTNPDIGGEAKEWDAQRTQLTWDSIECANVFSMKLTGNVTDENTSAKTEKSANIRITEQTDNKDHPIKVEQYVEQKKANSDKTEWVWKDVTEEAIDYPEGTPEIDKVHTFKLSQYQIEIGSTYDGYKAYEMSLMAELEVQQKEDGGFSYTLKLPDVTDIVTHDGTAVSNVNFAITNNVVVTSNVTGNLDGKTSDAYVESKETEIKWNK